MTSKRSATIVPVADAKRRFSELIDRVDRGDPLGLAAVAGALGDWHDLPRSSNMAHPHFEYGVRSPVGYTRAMHRTTLVVDERKLAKARKLLGTRGIKDTIERALDEVIASELRRQAFERLRTMTGLELDNPEVMAKAWR